MDMEEYETREEYDTLDEYAALVRLTDGSIVSYIIPLDREDGTKVLKNMAFSYVQDDDAAFADAIQKLKLWMWEYACRYTKGRRQVINIIDVFPVINGFLLGGWYSITDHDDENTLETIAMLLRYTENEKHAGAIDLVAKTSFGDKLQKLYIMICWHAFVRTAVRFYRKDAEYQQSHKQPQKSRNKK